MGTQLEQRSPPNAPPGLNPLAKLGWQIRVNKYKPTAAETEVLSKCFEDARWYYVNGALLGAGVAWNVTGMGRKLKLIPRIVVAGVMALGGSDLGGHFAEYACIQKILALESSPLRGELISILREDYPDHYQVKADDKRIDTKSASEPEAYSQQTRAPVTPKAWAVETDNSSTKLEDWPEMLGQGSGNGQERIGKIPRIWEIAERKQSLRKSKDDGVDILVDPFDIVMQTGIIVDDVNDSGGKESDWVERRRSRMGAKERREYDKSRYEQRQGQHHY